MEAIPDAAVRLIACFFDAATVEAAVAYARGDRVQLVKPPPWPVVARVRGTAGYVVTVNYREEGPQLRGECSCPTAVDCKHAAATALVVFARERELAAARAAAARQAVVGQWLTELGRHGATGAAVASPARGERVVAYVLDGRDGELGLTVVQATRLRDGSLGAGSVIAALGDPHRGAPAWVDVDDLRRIAMLRAVTRAAPQRTRLAVDGIDADLLAELAGTGRLFWTTTRSAPLTYGPPITAALDWRPCPDPPGSFRLGLDRALVIVPARSCHYVDEAAAAIGPLELGVPPGLVHRLVGGPPVPAEMRPTVERSLRALQVPAALAPADPGVEPLQPRMVASLDRAATPPAVRVTGEASYGDDRYPLAAWEAGRPGARDLVAEGRYQARLDALLAGLPHGPRGRTSLELLADARHVAQVIVPALRAEGWVCVLSDDFPHEAPRSDVEWVEHLRPFGDPPAWFALELGVVIAGRTVPLLPILLQAIRDGRLVLEPGGAPADGGAGLNLRLPEGELVHVPAERIQRWLRPLIELQLAGLAPDGALRLSPVAAVALDDEAPGRYASDDALAPVRAQLARLVDLAPRREPAGFGGTLRPYQRLGLAWLRTLHDAGCGGLLADEMGLGKTVQVLAFLDGLRAARKLGPAAPALVVAPRSVVGTWAREVARFAPKLAPVIHVGADRAGDPGALTRAPLVITSYQILVRDLERFGAVAWTSVIFDEAQALKNPDTQLRAAAASLRATSRFCITGTPIENHLGELWSQIDLAMPGLLGRRRSFEAVFRRPIERHGDDDLLEHVRRRVRPFLLRRTKDSVSLDLPAKTEVIERVELDTAQRDLYESLRLKLDERVSRALAQAGIHASTMAILDALLKLRQCCCDPRLIKLPEARRVETSAKLERLMDMLVELTDSGRSTLVFSQFAGMLALIEQACAQAGLPCLKLTGATRDRDDVIRRFQDGEAPILLITLKAGGVGLNLTRADTVIHYDPWWNPAAEAQATDRAHRIGQTRPVLVYKLVAQGTLEEAILDLQDDKRQLGRAALRDGAAALLKGDRLLGRNISS
ncbi:MAG TPA: DEAD/DEAH box helicase [Kofleriaceae bacterium]|nr:DEAD/DEAH box helicase [Kofleriaceae bacterium]